MMSLVLTPSVRCVALNLPSRFTGPYTSSACSNKGGEGWGVGLGRGVGEEGVALNLLRRLMGLHTPCACRGGVLPPRCAAATLLHCCYPTALLTGGQVTKEVSTHLAARICIGQVIVRHKINVVHIEKLLGDHPGRIGDHLVYPPAPEEGGGGNG